MLTVQSWSTNDLMELWASLQDPEIYEFLPEVAPETPRKLSDRLEQTVLGSKRILYFTVRLENKMVGLMQATFCEHENKFEIGYKFAKSAWGKGVATEAVGLLIEELQLNFGQGSIRAAVDDRNLASIAVLIKNKFSLYGTEERTLKMAASIDNIYFRKF